MSLQHIIILLFATILATGAIVTGQMEAETAKIDHQLEITNKKEPRTTEPLHQDVQTVLESELEVLNANEITAIVDTFFQNFISLQKEEYTPDLANKTKDLLSQNLQKNISEDPKVLPKEIAITVGLLQMPEKIRILRTEQLSAETVNVIIEVTLNQQQSIQKNISVINEDGEWKIDSFEII